MPPLSKTIHVGVIVLALQRLRELKIPGLPDISLVARRLGVSRKTGYEGARKVRQRLENETSPRAEPSSELIALKIQNQILRYERDHSGVRFERGAGHLPRTARSLCVRLLREFRSELPLEEIAALIGIPASSLRRWDQQADADGHFPSKTDLRGKHRRAGPEDVQRVGELFRGLQESISLEEFTQRYNDTHPDRPLDRKTITRILRQENLLECAPAERAPPYHPKFQVYFPGAQVSLDATEFQVTFPGPEEETVAWKKEFAVDVASLAIVGHAIDKEETAEGVQSVLVQAHKECSSLLAVLADNGSANRSATVRRVVDAQGGVEQIFSFPAHPQTNGHIEGLFGQMSRLGKVKKIQIDDTSREAIAKSFVEAICETYVHFHNHSPRRRLGGKSPLEYLRSYAPRPEEIEAAREGLRKQRARSEAARGPDPRLQDPSFQLILQRIEALNLGLGRDDAAEALLRYDQGVIESAWSAFLVQSQRKGFDERKRNFAYFLGIVRNKQKDVDSAALQTEIGLYKTQERMRVDEEHARKIREEESDEEQLLETQPEKVVLRYADMLLRGRLHFFKEQSLSKLRRGLQALRFLGRATAATWQRLRTVIRSWGQYSEDLKAQLIGILEPEFARTCGLP